MKDLLPNTIANFTDNRRHRGRQAGFTLLYTVVVVSVLIMLGSTLAGIFKRQISLTTSALNSSKAFYAADSGLECAMFFDRQFSNWFANQSYVYCAGAKVPLSRNGSAADIDDDSDSSGTVYTFQFKLLPGNDLDGCAQVKVWQLQTDIGATTTERTFIRSRGFNTCTGTNRRVEQALQTYY